MKNVEAWLCITTMHMAMNHRRNHFRIEKRDVPLEEMGDNVDKIVYLESLEDSIINEIDIKARADLAEKVYAELYEKNPRWYEAMTITYILEKPQKEVAEVMGMSSSALYMMLSRAKKWIRKRYKKEYDHLGEE